MHLWSRQAGLRLPPLDCLKERSMELGEYQLEAQRTDQFKARLIPKR